MDIFDFGTDAIQYWAVFGCMFVSIVIGSIWFGPKTFFPIWWKGIGKTEHDKPGEGQNMAVVFGLTFVTSFVQALFFAVLVEALFDGGASVGDALLVALFVWAGFTAVTSLSNKLFAAQPWYVWVIETGNVLITYVCFAIIIGIWG